MSGPSTRRPRRPGRARRAGFPAGHAVAAALAALIGLAACSVGAEDSTRVVDDRSVPFGLLDPDVPPLATPSTLAESELVDLCFLQGEALTIVAVPLSPPVRLYGAVRALADPPSVEGERLRTALTDGAMVRSVRPRAGIATVDLLDDFSDIGGDDQLLAVAQIVCTLTGRPGIGQVSFTLEGVPVDVPRSNGSLSNAPVSRDDYAALLPAP